MAYHCAPAARVQHAACGVRHATQWHAPPAWHSLLLLCCCPAASLHLTWRGGRRGGRCAGLALPVPLILALAAKEAASVVRRTGAPGAIHTARPACPISHLAVTSLASTLLVGLVMACCTSC